MGAAGAVAANNPHVISDAMKTRQNEAGGGAGASSSQFYSVSLKSPDQKNLLFANAPTDFNICIGRQSLEFIKFDSQDCFLEFPFVDLTSWVPAKTTFTFSAYNPNGVCNKTVSKDVEIVLRTIDGLRIGDELMTKVANAAHELEKEAISDIEFKFLLKQIIDRENDILMDDWLLSVTNFSPKKPFTAKQCIDLMQQLVINLFEYVSERENLMHRLGVRSYSTVAGAAKVDSSTGVQRDHSSMHPVNSYNSISVGAPRSTWGGSERHGDGSYRFDVDDPDESVGQGHDGGHGSIQKSSMRSGRPNLDAFPEDRDLSGSEKHGQEQGYSGSAMAAVIYDRSLRNPPG